MSIKIVTPAAKLPAYHAAAETFHKMYISVYGESPEIVTDCDITETLADKAGKSDVYIIIGGEEANTFTADCLFDGIIDGFGIRCGSDGYAIKSAAHGENKLLFIAGGRGRSTIYAVYRYFELFAGCRYFWDGDIIPAGKEPQFDSIDIREEPRFEYRGIRYFAHRSLHRFQAEHWGLADWKREIDWLLKKRLNMFMLRIGLDDIFQRAFPGDVPYPSHEGKLPEAAQGYDDRTLFWSLEYRSQLRKQLLDYAFERDIEHPEDCGTMTHWYSRTPLAFLDNQKPTLLDQTTHGYRQRTGLVWDIREDRNLENYFKLTEAHIKYYGKPNLFHTIGLAERRFSEDREENLRLKMYVYRRISSYLKNKYPNAPLFVASWDLWMYYTPEEVKRLVSELDPSQAIILDYTSDTARDNNFTNWGVVGEFPWIFGIFGGYQPNNEFRGDYKLIKERLKIAKADKMCRGLIYWPELSHGDTLMIEYFAINAWEDGDISVDSLIEKYCRDRYIDNAEEMLQLWRFFMPIVSLNAWSVSEKSGMSNKDTFPTITRAGRFNGVAGKFTEEIAALNACSGKAALVLRGLAGVWKSRPKHDTLLTRDIFDISRTVIGRYIDGGIFKIKEHYAAALNGSAEISEKLNGLFNNTLRLNELLADLLGGHEDFSLNISLDKLRKESTVNSVFEDTLKHNAENGYCRSYIYENAVYLYIPEMKIMFEAVKSSLETGKAVDRERITILYEENRERFYNTPICEMRPTLDVDLGELLGEAADIIEIM